ncbi:alpha/beta fold hydrolase [Rhizobium rhizogenes]|uniref:alpha/beta fold hydrolase n=1 Tax=Rhizobium rhizogenes TaxID=359 RepID=UPI001574736E|nr:alpha/beta hydrolase [Rhizobium rhizogenes]NTF85313.1 alpha/beta hydrolase [Rhizobium rhizogenes]
MKNILSTLMLGAAVFGAAPVLAQPARNIVLVHGAFADESSWDKVAAILGAKGYHVTQVANPLTSLADDVAATKAALAAQDGPTVLVAHSWGGVVIGEAGDDAKAIRPNDKGAVIVDPAVFPTVFAGDLPQAEAEALAQKQLPSNPANFEAVTEVAAWHDKPNFYVVTTEDRTVPADAQRVFASRMKAEVTEIAASHAGLISKAEDVAGVIEKAAR